MTNEPSELYHTQLGRSKDSISFLTGGSIDTEVCKKWEALRITVVQRGHFPVSGRQRGEFRGGGYDQEGVSADEGSRNDVRNTPLYRGRPISVLRNVYYLVF